MGILIRDPVCGMQVESDHYTIEYLQMHYAFCSRQCQERFLENPHLYVGLPGHKAPKQEGLSVIKQRRLRLAQPLSPSRKGAKRCIAGHDGNSNCIGRWRSRGDRL